VIVESNALLNPDADGVRIGGTVKMMRLYEKFLNRGRPADEQLQLVDVCDVLACSELSG
jgi:hypothetical protein